MSQSTITTSTEDNDNHFFLKTLGKVIRMFRKSKNLSQRDLARRIDSKIDASYIGRIERGQQNPSLKTIEKIIKAMDIKWVRVLHHLVTADQDAMLLTDKKRIEFMDKINQLSVSQIDLYFELMNVFEKHLKPFMPKEIATPKEDYTLGQVTVASKEALPPAKSQKAASRTAQDRYPKKDHPPS